MVYASPSLALASIELYVHLDPSLIPGDFVSIVATLPKGFTQERIEIDDLPRDWRDIDHPDLKRIGAAWIASGRSLALEVPSAAVEGEWNILLNPRHREFSKIRLDAPAPWKFNDRLYRRSG